MERNRLTITTESRILGDEYVRFGGEYIETCFHKGKQGALCLAIWGIVTHFYEEPNIEVGKPIDCNVVVNREIELTEEEKAEARQQAIMQYRNEELRKLQVRANKQAAKRETTMAQQPSLFDF